jgi:hypothetical protein
MRLQGRLENRLCTAAPHPGPLPIRWGEGELPYVLSVAHCYGLLCMKPNENADNWFWAECLTSMLPRAIYLS